MRGPERDEQNVEAWKRSRSPQDYGMGAYRWAPAQSRESPIQALGFRLG